MKHVVIHNNSTWVSLKDDGTTGQTTVISLTWAVVHGLVINGPGDKKTNCT